MFGLMPCSIWKLFEGRREWELKGCNTYLCNCRLKSVQEQWGETWSGYLQIWPNISPIVNWRKNASPPPPNDPSLTCSTFLPHWKRVNAPNSPQCFLPICGIRNLRLFGTLTVWTNGFTIKISNMYNGTVEPTGMKWHIHTLPITSLTTFPSPF